MHVPHTTPLRRTLRSSPRRPTRHHHPAVSSRRSDISFTQSCAGPLLAALLFAVGSALAADGEFDPTFGDDGVALMSTGYFGFPSPAVQPDGKILVCAEGWPPNQYTDFGIERFNADGTLDPGFGSAGGTMVDFGSSDVCSAIAVQPDGRIVVAGFTTTDDPAWGYGDFAVARLDTDGSLDADFGEDSGRTILELGQASGGASAVAIQSDGRIVLVGSVNDDESVVVRLRADGSRDDGFGNAGVVAVGIRYASGVAIDTQGRIVVSGQNYIDGVGNVFAAARLLATGEPDPDFDGDGMAIVDFDLGLYGSGAYALALQGDGKIAMAGRVDSALTGEPNQDMAVVRLLSNGSPDAAFGANGKVFVPFDLDDNGSDSANSIVWQSDGKLVIAGHATLENDSGQRRGAVVRLNADGNLDESFGVSGKLAFNLGTSSLPDSLFCGLALQGSRIIGTGWSTLADLTSGSFIVRWSVDHVFTNGFE